MEKAKIIIVSNIKWDAPRSTNLPQEVIIDINERTEYLLEDIDGYADNVCEYLSDAYEYCIKGFNVECR